MCACALFSCLSLEEVRSYARGDIKEMSHAKSVKRLPFAVWLSERCAKRDSFPESKDTREKGTRKMAEENLKANLK